MADKKNYSPELIAQVVNDLENGLTNRKVAKKYSIPEGTVHHWNIKRKSDDKFKPIHEKAENPVILPSFLDDEAPIEELIQKVIVNNKRRIESENSKKWFTIKAPIKGPFALMFFGDPHVDDNYCNWELLKKHCDLAASHERIYGINIGDTHNNWVGRLAKLYINQDVTQRTAYRFAEWFLFQSGVKWLIWLMGNHDAWNDGIDRLKAMGGQVVPMLDWRAQFKIECYNGREILIDAAHDHKGHSKYNELHAQDNVALMEKTPHLAIAGHRHHPALKKKWIPAENMVSWLARLGSYKWVDAHAKVNGFYDYQDAPAMLVIIDPDAESNSQLLHVTDNIEIGIDLLNIMISKRQKKK